MKNWNESHNPPSTAATISHNGNEREAMFFVSVWGDEFSIKLTANDARLLADRLRDVADQVDRLEEKGA